MVAAEVEDVRSVIRETTHHYRLGRRGTVRPVACPLGLSPVSTAREVANRKPGSKTVEATTWDTMQAKRQQWE